MDNSRIFKGSRERRAKQEADEQTQNTTATAKELYDRYKALIPVAVQLRSDLQDLSAAIFEHEDSRAQTMSTRSKVRNEIRLIVDVLGKMNTIAVRAALGMPPLMSLNTVNLHWMSMHSMQKPILLVRDVDGTNVVVNDKTIGVMRTDDVLLIGGFADYFNERMASAYNRLEEDEFNTTIPLMWGEDNFISAQRVREIVEQEAEENPGLRSFRIRRSGNKDCKLPTLYGHVHDMSAARGVPIGYVSHIALAALIASGLALPEEDDEDDVYDLRAKQK